MEPLICSGDMVMIDRGRTTIHEGKIYAIGIHDAIYLKKLVMLPNGRVNVVSENSNRYPPVETDYESLRIIGQIVWAARQFI